MSWALFIEKAVPPKVSIPTLIALCLMLAGYVVQKVHAMETTQAVIDSQQDDILRRLDRIEAAQRDTNVKLDVLIQQKEK